MAVDAGAPAPAESAAAVAGDGAAPKVNPILLDMRCCQFFQLLGPHPLRYYTLIREAFDGVFFHAASMCMWRFLSVTHQRSGSLCVNPCMYVYGR